MNKYTDVEIQTAKNLLEKGYKWIVRDSDIFGSNVYAYAEKPYKELYGWQEPNCCECVYICSKFASIFQNIRFNDKEPTSLESIVHPQILDDAERRYLSAVIRPFRNEKLEIVKHSSSNGLGEWLNFVREKGSFYLPNFKTGTMYKGMEPGHKYTLEELGL